MEISYYDELLGFWKNGADDGSGLPAIWGFGLEFLVDGTGISHHWGSTVDEEFKQTPFFWKRLGSKKIEVLYGPDPTHDEWELVEYEISEFIGAYDGLYLKLVEVGKEEFWIAPEPIYKSRQ